MRNLLAISLLFVAEAFAGEHHFVSPNGKFEAYAIAANEDGTGMKLFLRSANSHDAGVLLRENNRWIDAKWSPDSRFLAVIDHFDGHTADVYVFGANAADAAPTLLYHTPNPRSYDVRWDVIDWRPDSREVVLRKEVKHSVTPETIVARIGTKPLNLQPTE